LENVDFTFLFSSAYEILSDEDKRKNYDMYLDGKVQFGGDMYLDEKAQFGGTTSSQSDIRTINSQVFQKEIADQGITWLLLSYTPTLKGYQLIESIIELVGSGMQGALQVLLCFHFLFFFLLSFDFPLIIVHAYIVFPLTGWKHKL
jgi:curved DNA-binding protein CbpA